MSCESVYLQVHTSMSVQKSNETRSEHTHTHTHVCVCVLKTHLRCAGCMGGGVCDVAYVQAETNGSRQVHNGN